MLAYSLTVNMKKNVITSISETRFLVLDIYYITTVINKNQRFHKICSEASKQKRRVKKIKNLELQLKTLFNLSCHKHSKVTYFQ